MAAAAIRAVHMVLLQEYPPQPAPKTATEAKMNTPKQGDVYSYRADPSVPSFDDGGPVVFMDGECALCSTGARLICRLDKAGEFRICPTQNTIGNAVLIHYGFDPDDPDSWLYLVNGYAYTSMDAMIRVGRRLGGVGHVLRILSILPQAAQDGIYRRIARNRYRLFGRTRMCARPDTALRKRLIE